MNIFQEYERIMEEEAKLELLKKNNADFKKPTVCSNRYLLLGTPEAIYNDSYRLLEIAKNATILRSGNLSGHLTNETIAYESDSAHTNLVKAIVKYALDYRYEGNSMPEGYDRGEIDEAILLHDLPENETGDIPDNRAHDQVKKLQHDIDYTNRIMRTYRPQYRQHCDKIRKLLREMEEKSGPIGRLIYVADKISAVFMMLCYDDLGFYPRIYPGEEAIAKISQDEINMCTKQPDGGLLNSEMWTIDYLYGRELICYDDIGFCTAILVMTTLITHNHWYDWREAQYIKT